MPTPDIEATLHDLAHSGMTSIEISRTKDTPSLDMHPDLKASFLHALAASPVKLRHDGRVVTFAGETIDADQVLVRIEDPDRHSRLSGSLGNATAEEWIEGAISTVGVHLVAGPLGSGRRTTLAALIRRCASSDVAFHMVDAANLDRRSRFIAEGDVVIIGKTCDLSDVLAVEASCPGTSIVGIFEQEDVNPRLADELFFRGASYASIATQRLRQDGPDTFSLICDLDEAGPRKARR